jgi:transposase
MEVLHPKCAGLDVHRDTVVACARIAANSAVSQEVRTFGATTKELLALAEWADARLTSTTRRGSPTCSRTG